MAEVRDGSREDALRLSLLANAKHGKQRTGRGLDRTYDMAKEIDRAADWINAFREGFHGQHDQRRRA